MGSQKTWGNSGNGGKGGGYQPENILRYLQVWSVEGEGEGEGYSIWMGPYFVGGAIL